MQGKNLQYNKKYIIKLYHKTFIYFIKIIRVSKNTQNYKFIMIKKYIKHELLFIHFKSLEPLKHTFLQRREKLQIDHFGWQLNTRSDKSCKSSRVPIFRIEKRSLTTRGSIKCKAINKQRRLIDRWTLHARLINRPSHVLIARRETRFQLDCRSVSFLRRLGHGSSSARPSFYLSASKINDCFSSWQRRAGTLRSP